MVSVATIDNDMITCPALLQHIHYSFREYNQSLYLKKLNLKLNLATTAVL